MGCKKRLLPTAVPSVFPYRSTVGESPAAVKRKERLLKRTQRRERKRYESTKPSTSKAVETIVINPCTGDESMAEAGKESMIVTEDNSAIATVDSNMYIAGDDNNIVVECR